MADVPLFGFAWRGVAAVVLAAGAVFFMLVLFPAAARKSGSADNAVVDLQKAYTPAMFGDVLLRWSAHRDDAVGIMRRENIVKLDSFFPAIYGLAFALAYAALTGRWQPTSRDAVLFLIPIVAALFDYGENITHLGLLSGIDTLADVRRAIATSAFPPSRVFLASMFAYGKYLLLGASVLSLLLAIAERWIPSLRA